ncbi:MAG: biotin transporter BioY [Desulfitobacteriia bacterium]|jgi:biotin transport system substrate-specific component
MNQNSSSNLRITVYMALFTALIIIGGYITVPIGPVPIVLADFFVMLAGVFLGRKWGLGSVILYAFLGAIGLPVYAGGRAGLAVIFGPTGGFLLGYLVLVFVIGFIAKEEKPSLFKSLPVLILGKIFHFAIGIAWLKTVLNLTWEASVATGLTPFILGDTIKVVAVAAIAKALLPRLRGTITVKPES